MVLTDAALRRLVEARPSTRQDLAKVRGIGPRTLGKFGEDLLRLMTPAVPLVLQGPAL
jgi:superfamily II DNA helicase RecQ